jgi:hypothetical protein
MKRIAALGLALVIIGSLAFGTSADPQKRRRHHRRTVVVVHKHFPLHRPLRRVVIHPIVRPYRIAPRIFLPIVAWRGVVSLTYPAPPLYIWEDGETLLDDEEWTEFTLNCENTGAKLWLEVVSGRVAFDWAEVVFENGETQVVDMQESAHGPGHYPLLDFANGRRVDHVRMVARSETPESRVVLRMQK